MSETTANDLQAGGNHYKELGIQPWEVIDTWPEEQRIGYYRGTLLSYTMRMGGKGPRSEEAQKQEHLSMKMREVLEQVTQARVEKVQKRFPNLELQMTEEQLHELCMMIDMEAKGYVKMGPDQAVVHSQNGDEVNDANRS